LLKSHTGEKLDQQAIDNIAKYLGYKVDWLILGVLFL
jgi:hypothetical protein